MLQYYKLVLVRAGKDTELFKRELRTALQNLKDPADREHLKEWFKTTSSFAVSS